MSALRILGALWVLPVALPVWLLYLLPAWAFGLIRPAGRHGLVVEFNTKISTAPRWWFELWAGWAGHAMPFAIVLRISDDNIVRHELRHTDQWLLFGPLFPVVYGALRLLYGYERNPLEADARRYAGAR